MDQNRDPRNKPMHIQLINYDKEARNTQWGKGSFFNKWYWENWIATCKRMKLYHSLTPQRKVNSKQIKNLNIRPETIKLLEENIEGKLLDIDLSNDFLDLTSKTKATKGKVNKWDYANKKLLHSKGDYQQNEKATQGIGKNIYKPHI